MTALTNVGQHQKQDGRRETGSGNILGAAQQIQMKLWYCRTD